MPSKFIEVMSASPNLIASEKWLKDNIHYEVIMGSQAYGVSTEQSDFDIYGWAIPPKHLMFPHLSGHITGFGAEPTRFNQFQIHHVDHLDKQYDFVIYNVAKYLHLVIENNPNMIDSLFVPNNCVVHVTPAAQILRDHRKSFLHKGAFAKFKGYGYAQMHRLNVKRTEESSRSALIGKYGYDLKFAYHIFRLLKECEQILREGDLNLQANREQLKSVRRGEWTIEQLKDFFATQQSHLESLFQKCKLPEVPNWKLGNQVLHQVLEHHYGSITEAVRVDRTEMMLNDLKILMEKYS